GGVGMAGLDEQVYQLFIKRFQATVYNKYSSFFAGEREQSEFYKVVKERYTEYAKDMEMMNVLPTSYMSGISKNLGEGSIPLAMYVAEVSLKMMPAIAYTLRGAMQIANGKQP